ncbi:expressed protein [Echinococcus multilocularis]|uniref:Expressed protein n=1 Tax=Echinococcus multilocularis TaxID=6211 RepID=A0A068Y139_ECHMU|nr:expressed protein [Echinococcus multilocularis]
MYRPSQTPRLTMSPDRVARRTHTPTDNTTVHPPAAPAAAAAAAAAADSGQPAATEDAVTVLFNFPSRYLSAIGLVPVFSLGWSLPPTLGCNLKQPDS